jgi:molecular chaperone GrpE
VTSDPKTSQETEPANQDCGQANALQGDGEPQNSSSDAVATESEEDQLRAEVARLKDQLLRLAADFDNFRKRSRREISDAERMAREELLRELLPVFDNLDRASQHAGAATDVQSLVDGIAMVSRQFVDTLGRLGVERVAAVGTAFDPAVHEAVQQMETADQPPGMVCAEVLAGYRFGERLIRPAMVVVAKAPVSV